MRVWEPSLRRCAATVAVSLAVFSASGDDGHRWLSGSVLGEFASGYLSSGGALLDTRPVTAQELDWKVDSGAYGFLQGYFWITSSLHDSQDDVHRKLFNEIETAAYYGYRLRTSERTSVLSRAGLLFNPQIGYPDDNANYWGPLVMQEFENPFLTPYYQMLLLVRPKVRGRIRLGVRHDFALTDTLTLTPAVETVWSEERRFRAKYGGDSDLSFLRGGFGTERVSLTLTWRALENLSFYATVHQWALLDGQARDSVDESSNYYAKKDWIIVKVGAEYSF